MIESEMPEQAHNSPLSNAQYPLPAVHISYECVIQERGRESTSYLYEVACSIIYPATTGHLSLRVTGQNTYRNVPAREIPFTRHEAGATAYVELIEAEQLEVRVIEFQGTYSKASYYAHGQELIEQYTRHIGSSVQRIVSNTETGQNE
jgi:hypothetical protein